jgi:O-antigen/teichoic acid export membrane protein
LAASAAVAGLSVPVALSFSSGLTVGSTSTFYMGGKIFQSVSVFIGSIFLSLVLPYFIRLVHFRQREYAQKIFGDTLILGVYIATIVSLLICLIAPELAKFLFLGKKIGIEQLVTLSLVIQIGIVQLPFFVAALTIVKYLVALKETKVIFFVTIVGQIINAYISWLIVSHGLYVEMLSIGVAFGLAASSLLLIFWIKVKAILGWKGFYALFLILLLFATMVSSVLLSNYLALFFSFSIYIILPLLFKTLNHQRAGGLNPI